MKETREARHVKTAECIRIGAKRHMVVQVTENGNGGISIETLTDYFHVEMDTIIEILS